jgi:hypothetical protein
VATLVGRLDATDGLDRDRLVRAVGETVRTEGVPAGATLVPEWLLAHADTLEGERSTWAVRAIGTAVVATAAGEGVVEASIERIATAEGMSRVRAARALGEVALAAPVPDDDFPAAGALLDRIAVKEDAARIAAASTAGDVVTEARGNESAVPQSLVDRIHDGTPVERDLAARALGNRVATTTESTPEGGRLAADLVARARSPTTGTEPRSRWLAVQALGLAVASIAGRTGDAAVGFDRAQLARQVGDPTDGDDLLAARALGEALVVTDGSPTLAPSAWTDRVRAGRDETSKAAAWGLGVAAAAEGPDAFATSLVEATVNPPAQLQAAAVGRLVDEIAHTGRFPPDVLVPALTAGVRTHLDRNRSEVDESAYGHLLEAVASAVAEDTAHRRPGLRRVLHDVLAGPKESGPSPSPQTRLTAVDALAGLDSLAIENPSGSRGDDDDRG